MVGAHNSPERVVYPPNLEYPGAWQLGESGPGGLLNYMKWVLREEVRTASAAERFRFNGAGFHHHTAVQRLDAHGNITRKVDVNVFSGEFPPINKRGGGGHGHSRDSLLYAFYHPKARQTITHVTLLPPNPPVIPGIQIHERKLVILNKVIPEDGIGTIYNPSDLGNRHTRERWEEIPPLTIQWLSSLDLHEVQYSGDRAGATVLHQGPIEARELNTIEGLMCYKGLTRENADMTEYSREQIGDVAASTVLLREDNYKLEKRPMIVSPDRFAYLAEDVIYSLEGLMRSQAITA